MIDKICTPVSGGWYSVLRWDVVNASVHSLCAIADTVNNALSATVMKRQYLIPMLVHVADKNYGHRLFGPQNDALDAWIVIKYAVDDIAVSTKRTGGTTIAVTQEMYNFLKPHQPPGYPVIWVIDQSSATNFALVTYKGMQDSDGGYPCQDNGDGTVTLYNVHKSDDAYYRAVEINIPAAPVDEQKVSLNW